MDIEGLLDQIENPDMEVYNYMRAVFLRTGRNPRVHVLQEKFGTDRAEQALSALNSALYRSCSN